MKYQIHISPDSLTQGDLIAFFRAMRDEQLPNDPIQAERELRTTRCALLVGWLTTDSELDPMQWHARDVKQIATEIDRIYREAMTPDPKV